jgi:macrolide transport system ATP-binding/permease protein
LPSREQLEKTLSEFKGTIITVSHDYYFLNKLCDRLLIFEHQIIKRFDMELEEYLNKDKTNSSREEELMIIENKLASILRELSLIDKKDPHYLLLDQEFNDLLKKKRNLIN